MPRTIPSLASAAALAVVLAVPGSALAGSAEFIHPISLGAVGNRQLQASTLGFAFGPTEDRVHLLFRGRAMLGPAISAGTGGVSGGVALVKREHVHFGIDLGVSVGGGRYHGRRAGLLAAAEPSLFVRVLTEKIGVLHVDAAWYQPLYVRPGHLGGAAMLSIGWSPFFGR